MKHGVVLWGHFKRAKGGLKYGQGLLENRTRVSYRRTRVNLKDAQEPLH